jgi:signal transduction histidine kinase
LLVLQERERLVRELHRQPGADLRYTAFRSGRQGYAQAGRLPAADDSLDCLSQVIGEANTEVREFIFEVRNTLFFKDGFFAALRQYLAHFEMRFKIPVESKIRPNSPRRSLICRWGSSFSESFRKP